MHFFKAFSAGVCAPEDASSTKHDCVFFGVVRVIFVGDFKNCRENFVVLHDNLPTALRSVLRYENNADVSAFNKLAELRLNHCVGGFLVDDHKVSLAL